MNDGGDRGREREVEVGAGRRGLAGLTSTWDSQFSSHASGIEARAAMAGGEGESEGKSNG